MTVLFLVLYVAITIFIVVMWIRAVFDFVASYNRSWRPSGAGLVVAEIAYAVTDPPVKLVRRVAPPLRFNGVAFDLAWLIVLVIALVLSYICSRFL